MEWGHCIRGQILPDSLEDLSTDWSFARLRKNSMLISHRMSSKELSDLAHRVATSLSAGVDLRRTWQRETDSARGFRKDEFSKVQKAVDRGDDWAEALARTDKIFPPLFLEMVKVGEQTGQTAEVLTRLSNHYRMRYDMGRNFATLLAWPLLQLGLAVLVIGFLIWILGYIGDSDPLGMGLVGNRGLAIYTLLVATVAGAITALVVAFRRGKLWVRPVQRWLTSLPGLGIAIQKLSLARISWTLHLLLNVEMDMRQVIPLVFRSSGNDYYQQHTQRVLRDLASGQTLHRALANTGAFPPPFLDAMLAAEESGQISESMARLSKQYEEEAESAMKWIATLVGVAIWIAIGAIIIAAIMVIFTQLYLKPIQDSIDDLYR